MNKALGLIGENKAKDFLINKGYKIIETNYSNKIGEIDIVAQVNDTIVFVEVKTRSSNKYGYGREAVNVSKQNKIRLVATSYIKLKKIMDKHIRFDVIEINDSMCHIENAF